MVAFVIGMIFVALMGFRALAGQYSSHLTDGIVAASVLVFIVLFISLFG